MTHFGRITHHDIPRFLESVGGEISGLTRFNCLMILRHIGGFISDDPLCNEPVNNTIMRMRHYMDITDLSEAVSTAEAFSFIKTRIVQYPHGSNVIVSLNVGNDPVSIDKTQAVYQFSQAVLDIPHPKLGLIVQTIADILDGENYEDAWKASIRREYYSGDVVEARRYYENLQQYPCVNPLPFK